MEGAFRTERPNLASFWPPRCGACPREEAELIQPTPEAAGPADVARINATAYQAGLG